MDSKIFKVRGRLLKIMTSETKETRDERIEKLEDYARHGKNSDGVMCEKSKHSNFDCTCGLEKLLNYEEK